MAESVVLSANHALWARAGLDWTRLPLEPKEVEVFLGVCDAYEDALGGEGDVPCWAVPVAETEEGRCYLGLPRGLGFPVLLNFDDLLQVGFTADEILIGALDVTPATHVDPENGRPVCAECLAEAGLLRKAKKLPRVQRHNRACWSCAEALEEKRLWDESREIANHTAPDLSAPPGSTPSTV